MTVLGNVVPMVPPGPAPTPTAPGTSQPIAPGPTDADWGTDLADRLENVITTLLAQSNMPKRCRDVAWSIAAMDGAVIGAWPDLRHGTTPHLHSYPAGLLPSRL